MPMRSIIVLLVLATTLVSCGEYQRVLKETDVSKKYSMADSLFKKGKYRKSLRLYEQVVPAYRGKPQAERVQYLYATNLYYLKDYYAASYNYEQFAKSYPENDSAATAAFRAVESYYRVSPTYTLDQEDTKIALEKLQDFLTDYSDSDYSERANEMSAELQGKLERKEFDIAQQYLNIMDYKAAIAAFSNFINRNSGSDFQEKAYLRRIEASYLLAKHSIPTMIEERAKDAKEYYKEYIKYYKDAEFSDEAEELLKKINEVLETNELTS